MIVHTAVDDTALSELRGTDGMSIRTHRDVTKALAQTSIVHCLTQGDAESLYAAVASLPETARELWIDVLTALGDHNRITTESSAQSLQELVAGTGPLKALAGHVNLVVASEELADRRAVPDYPGFEKRPGEPEFTRPHSIHHCSIVERLETLHRRQFHKGGTPRDEIWKLSFEPLARVATEVTILDRFMFKHFRHAPDGSVDPGDARRIRHAVWLLTQLNATLPPGVTVRMLAEVPNNGTGETVSALTQYLSDTGFGGQRPGDLQVFLAPWEEADPKTKRSRVVGPHNRHIRFNSWAALDTPEGFDRLRNPRVAPSGITIDPVFADLLRGPEGLKVLDALAQDEQWVIEHSLWPGSIAPA